MAATLRKMPPPPTFINQPEINRWLIDLQAFILNTGGIDPSQIAGFSTVSNGVIANTASIITLNGQVSTLSTTVAGHTTQINANTSAISSNSSAITALQGRSQVRSGSGIPSNGTGVDGDWFADTTNKHIYVRVSGAYVLII
jgi:hypothetical protein